MSPYITVTINAPSPSQVVAERLSGQRVEPRIVIAAYADQFVGGVPQTLPHERRIKTNLMTICPESIDDLRVVDLTALKLVHAELGRLLDLDSTFVHGVSEIDSGPTRDEVRVIVREELVRSVQAGARAVVESARKVY